MPLEGRELDAPQRLGLLKPALQCHHRFRIERVDADPGVELRMALGHEAAFAQLPQMPAHGGQRQARPLRQLSGTMRPLAQEIDHTAAMRIGQRRKRAVDSSFPVHTQPSILRPLAFEPHEGGHFTETLANGTVFEIGRVRVWKPGERLVFGWRQATFRPSQDTEVEITFEAVGAETRVTVIHSGWGSVPPEHVARHGFPDAIFLRRHGEWWQVLLARLGRHAS